MTRSSPARSEHERRLEALREILVLAKCLADEPGADIGAKIGIDKIYEEIERQEDQII